jgi:hypothetical protein
MVTHKNKRGASMRLFWSWMQDEVFILKMDLARVCGWSFADTAPLSSPR